jgi:hypothetical protein
VTPGRCVSQPIGFSPASGMNLSLTAGRLAERADSPPRHLRVQEARRSSSSVTARPCSTAGWLTRSTSATRVSSSTVTCSSSSLRFTPASSVPLPSTSCMRAGRWRRRQRTHPSPRVVAPRAGSRACWACSRGRRHQRGRAPVTAAKVRLTTVVNAPGSDTSGHTCSGRGLTTSRGASSSRPAVMARAAAPSRTALSPSGPPACSANSLVCRGTSLGLHLIMG